MNRKVSLLLPLITVLLAMLSGYIIEILLPYSYDTIDLQNRLIPPNNVHLLGTDGLGRDVLVRLVRGFRNSITVSAASVAIAIPIAIILSTLVAINKNIALLSDTLFEVIYAFPISIAAMLFAAIYGSGINIVFVVQLFSLLPWFYRTLKTIAISVTIQPYFEAAQVMGIGVIRAAFKYITAASIGEIATLSAYGIADAIMIEASLSFLGLGFRPPEPSLGTMIYDGVQYLIQAPHILLASAAVIALIILLLNTVGDILQNGYRLA